MRTRRRNSADYFLAPPTQAPPTFPLLEVLFLLESVVWYARLCVIWNLEVVGCSGAVTKYIASTGIVVGIVVDHQTEIPIIVIRNNNPMDVLCVSLLFAVKIIFIVVYSGTSDNGPSQ